LSTQPESASCAELGGMGRQLTSKRFGRPSARLLRACNIWQSAVFPLPIPPNMTME